MASPLSDETVKLPFDVVTRSPGLAFDIGGSVAKIAYRSNKEYKNGIPLVEEADGQHGQIHLAMFTREKIDDVISFISENCDFRREANGKVDIYGCGVGGNEFKTKMEKGLNCNLIIKAEQDYFVKAFKILSKTLKREDFLYPMPQKAVDEGTKLLASLELWLEQTKDQMEGGFVVAEKENVETPTEDGEDVWPCLLAMCGSGSGIILINKDGTFNFLDLVPTGGRFFLGAGSSLVGVEDYKEIMEMASASDGRTVDLYTSDLVNEQESSDNIYSAMSEIDTMVFPFGKAYMAEKGSVKDGDLLFSLHQVISMVTCQIAQLSARLNNVKRVFFCGNFVESELARYNIKKALYFREAMQPKVDMQFLRHGGRYGAIGAFLDLPPVTDICPQPQCPETPEVTPLSHDILELPADIVEESSGVAIDIGGSVTKVVYRSNKDYKNGKRVTLEESASSQERGRRGIVHLIKFPREDTDDVIRFISNNCDFTRKDNGDLQIFATGIGGSQFRTKLEKELNCKVKVLTEFDCFVKAFLALTKFLSKEELLYPIPEEAIKSAEEISKVWKEWLANAEGKSDMHLASADDVKVAEKVEDKEAAEKAEDKEAAEKAEDKEAAEKVEDKKDKENNPYLPCIFAMCGSGSGALLIKEDGTFSLAEGVFIGGRFFLGAVAQLTGVRDFARMMSMAEASDGRTVDVYPGDLHSDQAASDDIYASMPAQQFPLYFFGKGYTSKREAITDGDIVHSLYNVINMQHIQIMNLLCMIFKAKNVFFAGNFIESEFARRNAAKFNGARQMFLPPEQRITMDFLRHGGMYGAIGAFLERPKPTMESPNEEKDSAEQSREV